MGASNFPGLAYAKGTPSSLVAEQTRKLRRSRDDKESDKVRVRCAGRCEISVIGEPKCKRKAEHVHHMIGGRMRGRGASALQDRKQAACSACHLDLTGTVGGKTLKRDGGPVPFWTDRYRRVK